MKPLSRILTELIVVAEQMITRPSSAFRPASCTTWRARCAPPMPGRPKPSAPRAARW
jgi:hypothetical protein